MLIRKNAYKQAREVWIDVCRGIGILLVLLGHCDAPFTKVIYGFHMPLFFLISGILISENKLGLQFQDYIKIIAKAYIIPYFVLSFVNLFINSVVLCIKDEFNINVFLKFVVGIVYSRGSVEWMPNCSPLWFLTAIFAAMLLYYWIYRLPKYCRSIGILFCVIISYVLDVLDYYKLPWNIDTAMMAILFIYVGHQARVLYYDKLKHQNIHFLYFWIILMAVAGVSICKINPVEYVNFDNNDYGNLLAMIAAALLISISVITFCYSLKDFWNNRIGHVLSFFGRHTLFIMGFDYFSGLIARNIPFNVNGWQWSCQFLIKTIIIIIGIHLWYIFIRIFPETINRNLRY